jgi:hypothetical protein
MKLRLAFLVVVAGFPLVACIFDSGGEYQGGGRRSSTPTEEGTATSTNTVPTVVPTLTPAPDSGSAPRDASTDG